jgi:SPX domain protein involved in polyphosphate accumulation
MTEMFEAVRKRGKKSDKEVDGMIKLAREVQEAVRDKKLEPGMHLLFVSLSLLT